MPTWNVPEVEGFDDIHDLIRRLTPDGIKSYGAGLVAQLSLAMEAEIKPYPPNGPWNQPSGPGSHWYERHFGPRWMTADGQIHGRNTSERLQKRWERRKISWREWELSNGTSYAIFVVGDAQRKFHRKHGWRNVNRVLRVIKEKYLPRAIRVFIARAVG